MRNIAVAAAAAALSTFASFGLSRAAPQPVRRGQVDLSSPYIPPAKRKPTADERRAVNARIEAPNAKRARKAARNIDLVRRGGLIAA